MRTTKELLEVMLENICYLESGLCLLASDLAHRHNTISIPELFRLNNYMHNYLPAHTFFYRNDRISRSSFPFGEKQPRIDWLKQQIEKLEQTK